jgi:ribosome-associated translation inhibitor RaiA
MVVVRGDVPNTMVAYAREKARHVVASTTIPVLNVRVRLERHADPARHCGNHVEMSLDLDGTPVRAHRSAPTMHEAIDGTCARLRRRLEVASERARSIALRHRDHKSWHHDDLRVDRPAFFSRPPDGRQVVRCKTFALTPEPIDEALADLELLDHDFFLFRHDETGAENVVYRTGHAYGIMQRVATPKTVAACTPPLEVGSRPARETIDTARTMLDLTHDRFVFFVDMDADRACVLYRRYDGHYGLVVPA